jgi:iron complex transport system substrate-binding protein
MAVRWAMRFVTALVLAFSLLAAACGIGNDDSSKVPAFNDDPTAIPVATVPAFPITVQRSDAKALTIEKPPARIVSLSPGATEIIYAIGAEGSLAAVDNQADFPDAAKNFPAKVDAYEPNLEAIAGLNPDLVVIATDSAGIVGKLDALNIPVLYSDIDTSVKTVDDVLGQIRLLGQVTGHTEQAVAIINDLGPRVKAVRDALQGTNQANNPKIYHELDSTFYTVSNASFIGDLYNILRVNNIAGDGGGQAYPQMTQEAIIAANPGVIILADEEFGVTVDSVKARPGWDATDAVKDGAIYGIDPDIISRPGPRIVGALEQLAKYIYPERFP